MRISNVMSLDLQWVISSLLLFSYTLYHFVINRKKVSNSAISVNYHFTRQCNYKCKFCFHTSKEYTESFLQGV